MSCENRFETAKCDRCGWYGHVTTHNTDSPFADPNADELKLFEDTKHGKLCASCRVDIRLETGYYEE